MTSMPHHATDLSMPPPADGIIPIDIAVGSSSSNGNNSNQAHMDVAGVLRRNQACLQCRKRKLKCDAVRPHCATCVRSYRHLLRTAPKSNPKLRCDYEDGSAQNEEVENVRPTAISVSPPHHEEDDTTGKKKRKVTGEPKRKKKGDDFEEERLRLQKQIDELQAQLATNNHPSEGQSLPEGPAKESSQTWSNTAELSNGVSSNSTNSFLDMLSSTASSSAAPPLNMWGEGSVNLSQNQHSQPFQQTFTLPYENIIQNDLGKGPSPPYHSDISRKSTDLSPDPLSSGESSSGPNILSPNGVFNFSPADTTNLNWPPPPNNPDNIIEPSTRLEGPWRGVETAASVFEAGLKKVDGNGVDIPMETDINLDGLQAGLDAAMQQQLLMDLFWPGWPPNLPEPNVVNDLIEAFFDLVPNLPRVLHRARFLARMALPPTHSNFPHPALIHAVCTAAASWCPPSIYEKSALDKYNSMTADATQMNGGKNPLSFGLRQASYAKVAVREGLDTGNRLFDVVRAMIILSRVYIDDTRMLECWAYCGLVARMILPLGLNVRSAELSLKSVMLPPPADALEREERRAATWMAFYHDTIASSASGWGTSIAMDELTVALPVSTAEFELGLSEMEPNPQDLEAPDFWIKHPVADSFVMVVKATVLINRVNRFVRKWKNRHLRPGDDFDGLERPEFKELANAIACFQMSFPTALKNYCKLTSKRRFDIDLIAAHMIPHAAAICLFEPFADLNDENDLARRRLSSGTQGIISIVQNLASIVGDGGSNFTSVMHPSASVCLVTAARTSLLFLRHSLNVGDYASAQAQKMDAEILRMALSQFGMRFKIGHHHSQLIEYFLDRATNPTYEKLRAHYPDHPRLGAPELHPNADFGACVLNALNIKRGYWRITASSGQSPYGSTPDSGTSGSGSRGGTFPSSSTNTSLSNHLHRVDSNSSTANKQASMSVDETGHAPQPNSAASQQGVRSFTSIFEQRLASKGELRPDGHMSVLVNMTEDDVAATLLQQEGEDDLEIGNTAEEDVRRTKPQADRSLPHTRPLQVSPVELGRDTSKNRMDVDRQPSRSDRSFSPTVYMNGTQMIPPTVSGGGLESWQGNNNFTDISSTNVNPAQGMMGRNREPEMEANEGNLLGWFNGAKEKKIEKQVGRGSGVPPGVTRSQPGPGPGVGADADIQITSLCRKTMGNK